jgi:hypothetical protein
MTPLKHLLSLFLVLIISFSTKGQNLSQTIRGTVVDNVSQMPLPGANVTVINSNPLLGAVTDGNGQFKIMNVIVGTVGLKISFVGYKDLVLPNVLVNSGKEVVLNIPIEEDMMNMEEIVVTSDKDKPLNDMSLVSTRTFSVEETRKYAAGFNDPARTVSSFAGVVSSNDGNNSISIRGNSPFGLLWRMEGVDIPNPNHFANAGSAGGGVAIISSQLLANSDFSTGAFAAEYGNALSGVFDLKLRKGNNEKSEQTIQAGFLGVDAAIEGPFAKGYKGSYLVNYRYSTLSMLTNIGVPINNVTNFQDLSFNIHLPTTKNSTLSLFGFGGLSNQRVEAERDSLKWESQFDKYDGRFVSNTGAMGIKYSTILNAAAYLQHALVISGTEIGYTQSKLDDNYIPNKDLQQSYVNTKITWSSVLNYKLSPRYNLRSGIYLNQMNYNFGQSKLNETTQSFETQLDAKGNTQTVQAFSQINMKVTDKLTLNAGLHYLQLLLNNSNSIEPRLSASYSLTEKAQMSIGYGMHSQVQPLGTYFGQQLRNGESTRTNQNLKLSKAHHFVMGYDRSITKNMRVKVETYYQYLLNIPVKDDPTSSFALINRQWDFETEPLVSKGLGKNYGAEFTLEQFMHNNLYFIFTTSLYQSKYKALDGVWRNTRYNGNVSTTLTGGKEFMMRKNRVFGINIRTIYSGGFRTTPIDMAASLEKGETVYFEDKAFTDQVPGYFRADLGVSLKRNRPRSTHTLALDIQNVTNRQNVFGQYFDVFTGKVTTEYHAPLIPILSYKVEF